MLCEKCQKNAATVYVERSVNGEKTVSRLCAVCAAGLESDFSFESFIKNLIGSIFEYEQKNTGEIAQADDERCPGCGLTYGSFKSGGRIGCAECYKAFRARLDVVLKNIHGSAWHTGKLPNKTPPDVLLRREIVSLKKMLKEAIENEEFETAAELRDKIRMAERTEGSV